MSLLYVRDFWPGEEPAGPAATGLIMIMPAHRNRILYPKLSRSMTAQVKISSIRLLFSMAVYVVVGIPLVAYLWETLNHLLALHPDPTELLISVPVLPQLPEDFLHRGLSKRPLRLRGNLNFPRFLVLGEIASLLQLLDKVVERLARPFGEVVFVVELPQPPQCFLRIAGRMLEQILKQIKQLLEKWLLAAVALGIPFGVSETHGRGQLCPGG